MKIAATMAALEILDQNNNRVAFISPEIEASYNNSITGSAFPMPRKPCRKTPVNYHPVISGFTCQNQLSTLPDSLAAINTVAQTGPALE